MEATKIKTKYDYANHDHPGIHFSPKTRKEDRSMTNQADLEASDINKIMAKYEKTGVLVDGLGNERKPMYGDFTQLKNYHETLSAVRNAEQVFMLLPAHIRNRFENNPDKLIAFLEDRKNDEEAIKLGLREAPIVELTPEQIAKLEAEKPASSKTPPAGTAGGPASGGSTA